MFAFLWCSILELVGLKNQGEPILDRVYIYIYICMYVYIHAQPYLKQFFFQEWKNPLTTASMDSVYFLQHNDMKMQDLL